MIPRIKHTIFFLTLTATLLTCRLLPGQPMLNKQKVVNGVAIFPDLEEENVFYYGPGDLRLAEETNGKPRFQLLEMRYTGTAARDDQGEQRFTNLVQIVLVMESHSRSDLRKIKETLGNKNIKLKPVPIQDIEAFLVSPVGQEDSGYKRIGQGGSSQSFSDDGLSSKYGYWTERAFTMRLENHEAQLLWTQVEKGMLTFSVSYAFYGIGLNDERGQLAASGDSIIVEELEEMVEEAVQMDSTLVAEVISSGAFPVRVDVEKYPDLLKKIDVNEDVPPAYAALEVKCYDFVEDLRPDLMFKAIEIQATGVGGELITLKPVKFSRTLPDLHTHQVNFPYAVKMNKPLRYRIKEYTLEGEQIQRQWITRDSWVGILDITQQDNLFEKKIIDVELEESFLEKNGYSELLFLIRAPVSDKLHAKSIKFKPGEEILKSISIHFNKSAQPTYQCIGVKEGGDRKIQRERKLTQDYYFIGKL